ncbi:MAG: C40 family peptidase [Bacteroidota bacterium]|nr:C40 family peptidase [Bacteroidota bacterium]
MFGINLNGLIPLRSAADEASEQLTQILFGEYFTVEEVIERWVRIHNVRDNETGWIDRKMMTPIDEQLFNQLSRQEHVVVSKPLSYTTLQDGTKQPLPGGSLLPFYDKAKQQFSIGDRVFGFSSEDTNLNTSSSEFVEKALTYLHAPYLWGGKNIMGIDCSGLVQVAALMCGKQLTRNARQQIEFGEQVSFLAEAQPGDVAFFDHDDGYISHVGILLNDHQILHASGEVHIAPIDNQGIKSVITGKYTHSLRVIKRIL